MPHPRLRGPVLRRLPLVLIGGLLLLALGCPFDAVAAHRTAPGPSATGARSALGPAAPGGPRADAVDASRAAPSCHVPEAVAALAPQNQRPGPRPADRSPQDRCVPAAAEAVPPAGRLARGPDDDGPGGRYPLSVTCRWRI
ncbi:hypothetical protein MOV08_40820 [Streptomyces yunnanensis]|uniref:Lipoprotein n=1 Tax=Streptomyces yunnanensis TaxID=156453 RepID=A0ABY8AN52_9ACTN|nr:hypothetical protein [Streptomyces yunnanensis]WEB45017.1 hypothetical protein MOV08_40820 [Streptomyces yunnanensis]